MNKIINSDRGDVPGWVLITLMTAGLVVVIWAFAAPALQGVFDEAMDRVVSF
jgi:F0F1-type ATP synthase membrane subunit b/b'